MQYRNNKKIFSNLEKIILSTGGFLTMSSSVLAAGITNPLKANNFQQLIGIGIKGLMGVVGSVALIMFIYGGIMWLISGGNPDQVKKGRQTIIWAVMGLVMIFSAYAILNFVFTILGSS